MEAVEVYHGEDIAAGTRTARFDELSTRAQVMPLDMLCGPAGRQPDDRPIPWVEGYDLLRREPIWIPWEIVHTDYTFSARHSGMHFLSGTNGLAGGNHLVEALTSAICELVERDAVALWNARRLSERANRHLDPTSIHDEDCLAILDMYARAGITPRIWDVTSDVGIAAFVCDIPAATDDPVGVLRRFRGAGCHPNRAIALARALTEAAQVRLTYIAGIRDDLALSDYKDSSRHKLGAALLDAASAGAKPRVFRDVPHLENDDLALDLRWELERLRAVGVECVAAVDLTRSDFGIPVVRVVIPGLEWDCTHPDYVPGPRARRISGEAL